MSKSTHKAEVVKIELKPHPNADSLSVVSIFGYTVCVRTQDWINSDKGVYITPDSLVNTLRDEFSFLYKGDGFSSNPDDYIVRVKTIKLRGVISMGLLIPAPADAKIGDDLAEYYGITRYQPTVELIDEDTEGPSGLYVPKYDIDSYHRYLDLLEDGEHVFISEKIEGENGRFVYHNGQFYCGSRTRWKKERPGSQWWQALENTKNLKTWLINHEGMIVYGEVYGRTGIFKYDAEGKSLFRAFDILAGTEFLDAGNFMFATSSPHSGIPTVPYLEFDWPLDKSKIMEYAEGQSTIGNHVREGCVIKPMVERQHESIGRVFLKLVGNGYYALK